MKTTGLAAMVDSKTATPAIGLANKADLFNQQATELENTVTGRRVAETNASQSIASPDTEAVCNAITPTMPYKIALSRAARKAPEIIAKTLGRDTIQLT